MVAPSTNPAAQVQPRHTNAASAPATATANIAFQIRSTALARKRSSVSAIARVFHQLADELHKPGNNSQNQERNVEPMSTQGLVQQITHQVPQKGGRGQQKSQ